MANKVYTAKILQSNDVGKLPETVVVEWTKWPNLVHGHHCPTA